MNEPLHLLIIDAVRSGSPSIEARLEHSGIVARCQRVGTESEFALALARSGWDLALVDQQPPFLNWPGILTRITLAQPDLPLLLLADDLGEDQADWLLSLGLTDFLFKDSLVGLVSSLKRALRRAEERRAAREGEERLHLALEATSMGIWELDLATQAVFWSSECYDLAGLAPAPMNLASVLERVHAEEAPRLLSEIEGTVANGGPFASEFRFRRADGEIRWISTQGKIRYDEAGRPLRLIGTAQDITAQRRIETRLQLQSAALEAAANAILITDREARIQWANPAFSTMTGYSLDEALGRTPGELLHSGIQSRDFYAALWETIREGRVWQGEVVNRRKDGRLYHEALTITPVPDTRGEIRHFIAIKQDITEMHQAHLALEASKEQLEALVATRTAALEATRTQMQLILDSSADALFGFDIEGHFTFVNPATCLLLGYMPEELIGESVHQTIHHSRSDGAPYPVEDCPMLVSLREQRTIRNDEEVFWRADGRPLAVEYAIQPMYQQGEIVGMVVGFRDISQRKAAEAAQSAALAEAERLARVRSEFLANMSHEIRTPLSAMLGLAQIGLRQSQEVRVRDTFTRILDSGQLLLSLINDILDFSKIEAGKLHVEEGWVDLGQVIDRVLSLTASQAYAKGLEFRVEEALDLPSAFAGDQLRLSQVLVNLIANAVKFTEQGRVSLLLRREDRELVFGVRDTGIGMTAEQLQRLFAPFEQADGSTTRRFGGSGLGLAICQRLVGLMGGRIEVQSRDGAGSLFEVRIPLKQEVSPPSLPPGRRVALIGLPGAEAWPLAASLAERGVQAEVLRLQDPRVAQAQLLVIAAEHQVQGHLLRLVQAAMQRGQRLALVYTPGMEMLIHPGLREGVQLLERPVRVRRIIGAATAEPSVAAPQGPERRLQGYRILAAEDHPINRLVLEDTLNDEGAGFECVENGLQALERVRGQGPEAYDLVLMDILMPEMDGYQATRRILELAPDLPIIGLTAHALPQERERCLAAGMVEHLAKPVEVDELVAKIRHYARPSSSHFSPHPAVFAIGIEPSSRATGTSPSGIDWSGLEERYKGKSSFVDRLAAAVLESHLDTPAQLRQEIGRRDFEALEFLAHSLKGVGGALMAEALYQLAKGTDEAALGRQTAAWELADRLAVEVEGFLGQLKQRLTPVLPREARIDAP